MLMTQETPRDPPQYHILTMKANAPSLALQATEAFLALQYSHNLLPRPGMGCYNMLKPHHKGIYC